MTKQKLYQAKTRRGTQLDAIQEYGRIIKKRIFDEPPQIIKKKDYDEYFTSRFGRSVNPQITKKNNFDEYVASRFGRSVNPAKKNKVDLRLPGSWRIMK
jgi:hypothetical protein